MGLLLKVILFGLVIYYIFRTIGNLIFRLLGGRQQQHQRHGQPQRRDGEVNIDYVPKDQQRRTKTSAQEGDYIDYEEVK
ncbi:MAG: DUF4834 family protein [Cytophagales bacterium]|nr:DUF4834 family protein [Cytophagales bacterium]